MQFYTATANWWQNLFQNDNTKDIIVRSMKWLVEHKKAAIHAFVIMPNHVHIVWTPIDEDYDLGGRFKSFTGTEIRDYLLKNNPNELEAYLSTQNDRHFHFWERRSMMKVILNRDMAAQKISYTHKNPLQEKWQLVKQEEDYVYSSASFYLLNDNRYSFLSRYEDWI